MKPLLFVFSFLLFSCGSKSKILGTWNAVPDSVHVNERYIFKGDGSLSRIALYDSGSDEDKWQYLIDESKSPYQLEILFPPKMMYADSLKCIYKFEGEDTLVIKYGSLRQLPSVRPVSFDSAIVFVRGKE